MTITLSIRMKKSSAQFTQILFISGRNRYVKRIGFILSKRNFKLIVLNLALIRILLKVHPLKFTRRGKLNKELLNYLMYLIKF